MISTKPTVDLDYLIKKVFRLADEDLHLYKDLVGTERLNGRCDIIRSLINKNCPETSDIDDIINYIAVILDIESNRAAFYIERTLFADYVGKGKHPASYKFVAQYLKEQDMTDDDILLVIAAVYGETLDNVLDALNDGKPLMPYKNIDNLKLQLYSYKRIRM